MFIKFISVFFQFQKNHSMIRKLTIVKTQPIINQRFKQLQHFLTNGFVLHFSNKNSLRIFFPAGVSELVFVVTLIYFRNTYSQKLNNVMRFLLNLSLVGNLLYLAKVFMTNSWLSHKLVILDWNLSKITKIIVFV